MDARQQALRKPYIDSRARKSFTFFALSLVLFFSAASVPADSTPSTYTNPVTWPAIADPGVIYYRGEYYLYPTAGRNPIGVAHSTDLANWTWLGDVLPHGTNGNWDALDIWAPSPVYDNGKFYLYYTATADGTDATRRVGYAIGMGPAGPFTSGGPLLPPFTIDPDVFRDPVSGRFYLYYNGPTRQNNVQELAGFSRLDGAPQIVTQATEGWEQIWNEAPWTITHHGSYYNFYSAACFCGPNYSVSYAFSGAPKGAAWTKAAENPILRSTNAVESPGSVSVVKGPGQFEDWMIYHARVPGAPVDARSARIDRLYWNADRPFLMPASAQESALPDPGTFRDLFNRPDGSGLGDGWLLDAADGWSISETTASQRSVTGPPRFAVPRTAAASDYVYDVFLRLTSDGAGSRVGVAAWYAGTNDIVFAWLDRDTNALITTGVVGGETLIPQSASLPGGTDLKVYHEMRVTKNGPLFSFSFDGLNLAGRMIPAGPGVPGLATQNASSQFDGAVYSVASEDDFTQPLTTWGDAPDQWESGGWNVADGVLHQTETGAGLKQVFKGTPTNNYEMSVDARLVRSGSSGRSRYGLIAAYHDAGDQVRALLDPAGPQLVIEALIDGLPQAVDNIALPNGFDPQSFHNLRATKDGGRFEFYLDNRPIASRYFEIGFARVGLLTDDVAADFDNALIKWINIPQNLILNPSFESAQAGATNPWQVTGRSSAHADGAHYWNAGGRVDGGTLVQHLSGLEPATAYTLTAWLSAPPGGRATVAVQSSGATTAQAASTNTAWTQVTVPFRTADTGGSADVVFSGTASGAAIDDLFLRKDSSLTVSPVTGTLQFSSSSYNVGEGDGGATITVTRTGDTSTAATVDYSTGDGTADQRTKYITASGTLNFAPGETSQTFTVLVIDEGFVEGNRTVNLTLSNPAGINLGAPVSALLTIVDNDTTPPATNPLDEVRFFVRQHYLDFLDRLPDQEGFDYWTGQLTLCGTDPSCIRSRRVGVSAAFFTALEFQQTGSVVYRLYKAAYGTGPTYAQFMADRSRLIGGPQLRQSTLDFADRFARRAAVRQLYPDSMTPAEFVGRLFDTAGLVPYTAERQQETQALTGGVKTRAQVLLDVIETGAFKDREFNPAFVLMQYYGYLRRDPDTEGYNFWLDVLNNRVPGNFRGMVCAFITSQEYQLRFSPTTKYTNADCGP